MTAHPVDVCEATCCGRAVGTWHNEQPPPPSTSIVDRGVNARLDVGPTNDASTSAPRRSLIRPSPSRAVATTRRRSNLRPARARQSTATTTRDRRDQSRWTTVAVIRRNGRLVVVVVWHASSHAAVEQRDCRFRACRCLMSPAGSRGSSAVHCIILTAMRRASCRHARRLVVKRLTSRFSSSEARLSSRFRFLIAVRGLIAMCGGLS